MNYQKECNLWRKLSAWAKSRKIYVQFFFVSELLLKLYFRNLFEILIYILYCRTWPHSIDRLFAKIKSEEFFSLYKCIEKVQYFANKWWCSSRFITQVCSESNFDHVIDDKNLKYSSKCFALIWVLHKECLNRSEFYNPRVVLFIFALYQYLFSSNCFFFNIYSSRNCQNICWACHLWL